MDSEKKERIAATFNTVATGYENTSTAFFPETAKRMVNHLDLDPSLTLLDVCAGTGLVSLRAAEVLSEGAVTGVDLSSGMLAQARAKAVDRGLGNVDFQMMDMEALAFPSHSFDVATCSFGLFFVEDMANGLCEISSKIKPGGRVAISTFSLGAFEPLTTRFLALYESYGYEAPSSSWKKLASHDFLREIFGVAGMDEVEVHDEPQGFYLRTADDWWRLIWNAGYRGLLAQMSEEELSAFKAEHLGDIEQMCANEKVWLDTSAMIAVGTKASETRPEPSSGDTMDNI